MTWFMDPMPNKRRPPQHRVLMHFMHRNGYCISFLEEDCKMNLKLKLIFATPDKIIEMHERWGEIRTHEARQKIERDIAMGRPGGVG
jgi:hypothetical protein